MLTPEQRKYIQQYIEDITIDMLINDEKGLRFVIRHGMQGILDLSDKELINDYISYQDNYEELSQMCLAELLIYVQNEIKGN